MRRSGIGSPVFNLSGSQTHGHPGEVGIRLPLMMVHSVQPFGLIGRAFHQSGAKAVVAVVGVVVVQRAISVDVAHVVRVRGA
ncbi:MAG: hypothetical protein WHF31_12500 [Candidatus Dehalobacter alkaniphilus]